MGFPYHFVNLDKSQLVRRRQLLDRYGQLAQISVIIIVLLSYLVRFAFRYMSKRHFGTRKMNRATKARLSPRTQTFNEPPLKSFSSHWLSWVLGEQLVQGWGTRKEWIIAGAWAAWLFVLVVRDTGDGMSGFLESFVFPSPG